MANASFNESEDPFKVQHLDSTSIGSLVIFSLIFLLGLPGNGLVIWVVALKMKRTVNTVWFLHLAVADFVCCLSLPFSIAQLALYQQWPYGWFLCKIIPSAIIFNMFASVFLLTTISIDRCLVVTKPVWCQNHRTIRFASVVCGVTWFLAFVMCFPAFFYREISIDESGHARCVYNWHGEGYEDAWSDYLLPGNEAFPTFVASSYGDIFTDGIWGADSEDRDRNTDKSKAWYSGTSSTLGTDTDKDSLMAEVTSPKYTSHGSSYPPTAISNIIYYDLPDYFLLGGYSDTLQKSNNSIATSVYDEPPSILVSITVTRTVFGFVLPFGIMAACYLLIALKMFRNQFARSRVKALRVILLVIATFFLCWAPYHVIGALYLLANPSTPLYEALALWDHISTALAYANSCINPLLYVFVGKKFREKARQTVQGILEGAFSEEGTCSTAFSQEKSKSTLDHDVDVSVL